MLLNATKFQGWAIKVKQVGKEGGVVKLPPARSGLILTMILIKIATITVP